MTEYTMQSIKNPKTIQMRETIWNFHMPKFTYTYCGHGSSIKKLTQNSLFYP